MVFHLNDIYFKIFTPDSTIVQYNIKISQCGIGVAMVTVGVLISGMALLYMYNEAVVNTTETPQ